MKYAVLGAGRQGVAAAYDLWKFGDADGIRLLDVDQHAVDGGVSRLNALIGRDLVTGKQLDSSDGQALTRELSNIDGVLCAVPYKFNLAVTEACLASGTNMVDLGGHTATVREQLSKNSAARELGITIVPDCGMGPGMNITLALLAMEQMDSPRDVQIWDGGLPQQPKSPWNYNLFFNINGLTNEYDGNAFFLEDGSIREVPGLTRREMISFPAPYGNLEAAVTTGGLSTMPWTWEGKLQTLSNKTLRYPGHWDWMQAYRELGLFSEIPIPHKGRTIVPREFYHDLLDPRINAGIVPDVCLMKVRCDGTHEGEDRTVFVDAIETYDEESGFLAMEKWTGWHASIMLILAVHGQLEAGVISVENALSGTDFHKEALRRGFHIEISRK